MQVERVVNSRCVVLENVMAQGVNKLHQFGFAGGIFISYTLSLESDGAETGVARGLSTVRVEGFDSPRLQSQPLENLFKVPPSVNAR